MPPIPVFILSGFLGAGKTTLLNYILHHQIEYKIAVIENEFGNAALDTKILSCDARLHITSLKNGCICCNSNTELQDTLATLLQQLDNKEIYFTQLIIECTGMANPAPIIQTFLTHKLFSERFDIKGTIVMIDAINAPYHFKHFNVTQAQVAMGDLILLSKTDLSIHPLKPLIQQLRHMNSTAPIHYVRQGRFNLQLLNELNSFNNYALQKKSLFTCTPIIDENISYDTQVNSFVIRREKAFNADELSQLIDKILGTFRKQLIRYKGIFNIEDNPNRLIFQGLQQIYNSEWGDQWKISEIRYSEVVFIGIQLPEDEFRYFFDQI